MALLNLVEQTITKHSRNEEEKKAAATSGTVGNSAQLMLQYQYNNENNNRGTVHTIGYSISVSYFFVRFFLCETLYGI